MTRQSWLRLGAYLLVVIPGGLGLYQVTELVHDEAEEDEVETAQACVTAWSVRENLRDSGEEFARGSVHTAHQALVQIGIEQGSPPQPGVLERFNEITNALLADDIAKARATISDPECDLKAAERRLEEG